MQETSVHERRYDDLTEEKESVSYMATALSVADLYCQVNQELEGTDVKIPSLQWLQWQFWPSLKNSANAKHMTCKINIKYMVQSRLLRKSYIDSYYCAANFRYLYSIQYPENINLLFEDDKHTLKIGEPSYPVAAIEHGKSILFSKNTNFKVADHDFTNTSFIPSTVVHCTVQENMDGDFYLGDLYVGLKESAFQHSSILQHMAENEKILENVPFKKLKNCSGLNDIREAAKKHPELKEELLDAVEPS